MILQAALNGARAAHEHPALPLTTDQIVRDVQAVTAVGAETVHFHVRDGSGRESLDPLDVARTLDAIRTVLPAVTLGISTGAWIVPDVDQRRDLIQQWTTLPDYVSLNMDEHGAPEIGGVLLQKGVAIEAGLANPEAATIFVHSDLIDRCCRVLIELEEQNVAEALATTSAIETILNNAGVQTPRLLHGIDQIAWDMARLARDRGYATRIGFEDTLDLPDGTEAPSNAALVAAAHRIIFGAQAVGRDRRA